MPGMTTAVPLVSNWMSVYTVHYTVRPSSTLLDYPLPNSREPMKALRSSLLSFVVQLYCHVQLCTVRNPLVGVCQHFVGQLLAEDDVCRDAAGFIASALFRRASRFLGRASRLRSSCHPEFRCSVLPKYELWPGLTYCTSNTTKTTSSTGSSPAGPSTACVEPSSGPAVVQIFSRHCNTLRVQVV
jgi:hypothetical protein